MKRFLISTLCTVIFLALSAQEKTYTHTDAYSYAPGERIWLKVYVADADSNLPVADNLYAHVVLTDDDGTEIKHAKLMCRNGIYAGYIDIPASAKSGHYHVYSYTKTSLYSMPNDNPAQRCPLTIATVDAAPDSVALRLSIPDLHEDEIADISIAVTKSYSGTQGQSSSIITAFSMPCENENPDHCHISLAIPDTTQTLTGQVVSLSRHRPQANATVSVIAPRVGFCATTTTDSGGRFSLGGLDFPDGTQYILRATKSNGREDVELQVDDEPRHELSDIPVCAATEIYIGAIPREAARSVKADAIDYDEGILLNDIEVTAAKSKAESRSDIFAQLADFSFGLRQIEQIDATCIHELLRRIPGVRLQHDVCYLRTRSSIYADTPAAIAIDGIIAPADYDLDNIQMQDVARVDVFKSGTSAIWGSKGGAGVISITTKTGNYEKPKSRSLNQRAVTPQGYQREVPFTPQSRKGRTIYWNPNVTTDTIQFPVDEASGNLHIVIEGITSLGRPIHEESDL